MSDADPLFLAKVLEAEIDRREPGARGKWLSDRAIDPVTNTKVLNVPSANDLLRLPRKGWMSPPAIRGVASAFGWRDEGVYLPNAKALNLTVPEGGMFAAMLPSWIDQLPPEAWRSIRDTINLHGRVHGFVTD